MEHKNTISHLLPEIQTLFPDQHSVIQLLESLILFGHRNRSSDIHIDPRLSETTIRLRVDGVLRDICTISQNQYPEFVSRIKICAQLRTDEHQAPHDGRFRILVDDVFIDIRVSIVPTYHGESVVLRLLVPQRDPLSLTSLGFSEKDQRLLLRALHKTSGMILVTGPTGSGKTTTLYTLLNLLNTSEVSIISLEDPIEYSLPGIKQIQVNQHPALTFSSGLRSVVRQDPNIIMVGEIRDDDTASLTVNAALTGHLILSTLHTNDAATTLPRLIDMHIEPYLIASTVSVAIGQRLVRKICEHCKAHFFLTEREKTFIEKFLPEASLGERYMRGGGCEKCLFSGFSGRLCINEILPMEPAIQDAILNKASASEINALARASGMNSMLQDGYDKATQGLTSIQELFRVLHE